jgi:hypothetical protein
MAGRYLVELGEVFRGVGLHVVEYDGWQTRARSSGGFAAGRPWCVAWHHTASDGPASDDAYYMCHVSDGRPVANVTIERDGTVWLLAAGASNTNGKGKALTFTKGQMPADSANTYAFGVEIINPGTGSMSFPAAQVDACFKVSNAVNALLGNHPGDVFTHQLYAPDRKVDPATNTAVQGGWRPAAVTSSGTWSTPDVAAECIRRASSSPTPEPEPPAPPPPPWEEPTMLWIAKDDTPVGIVWIGDNITRRPLYDMAVLNTFFDQHARGGPPVYSPTYATAPGPVTTADDVPAVPFTTLEWMGEPVDDD